MRQRYECDCCGACCRVLIVEIGWIDVLREPKLRTVTEPFKVPEGEAILDQNGEPIEDPDPYMAGANLACGSHSPCKLLGADNRCTIYPTRPNDCVSMQAGDDQCQIARDCAGLAPLEPVREAPRQPATGQGRKRKGKVE